MTALLQVSISSLLGDFVLTRLPKASYGNTMAKYVTFIQLRLHETQTSSSAQVVFHALLVTKMHRDLWEADRHADLPHSLDISLSTFDVASRMSQ